MKIKIDNIILYPSFEKASDDYKIAFFNRQVSTESEAKKLHEKYLKLSGNESNTRKTKRRVKKDNA